MNQRSDFAKNEAPQRTGTARRAAATTVGVAAELREDILRGEYNLTQRLPSERELAARFGASRGTIRTALSQLQDMNLVVSRQGSGTYVIYRDEDDLQKILEITSPLELIECRLAIEPHLARQAVLNAGNAVLGRMRRALEHTEASAHDPDQFSRADEQFHLLLAECAGNPLLLWIYRRVNDIRHQSQWGASKNPVLTPRHIAEYNQQHRELFTAISARDAKGAVQIMVAHLEKARGQLLGLEKNS